MQESGQTFKHSYLQLVRYLERDRRDIDRDLDLNIFWIGDAQRGERCFLFVKELPHSSFQLQARKRLKVGRARHYDERDFACASLFIEPHASSAGYLWRRQQREILDVLIPHGATAMANRPGHALEQLVVCLGLRAARSGDVIRNALEVRQSGSKLCDRVSRPVAPNPAARPAAPHPYVSASRRRDHPAYAVAEASLACQVIQHVMAVVRT